MYTSSPATGLLPAADAVQESVAPVDVTALAVSAPGAPGGVAAVGGVPQTRVLPEYRVMSLTVTGVAPTVAGMPWKDQSSAGS